MPELPEIEHLRQSLEPVLIEAKVLSKRLYRRDMVRSHPPNSSRAPARLLAGLNITHLKRRGKQLAIITREGPTLCVGLGMSGQLRYMPGKERLAQSSHIHCIWSIQSKRGRGRLFFRDPRRFGGLWYFDSYEDLLAQRWSKLGPDALTIRSDQLSGALAGSRRPIKAALLEQSLLAGVGNIYADECLHRAGIHPRLLAGEASPEQIKKLCQHLRAILKKAIAAGGTTVSSYLDANGTAGTFALVLRVYGRGGQPCLVCGAKLQRIEVGQRTTVFCEYCQAPGG